MIDKYVEVASINVLGAQISGGRAAPFSVTDSQLDPSYEQTIKFSGIHDISEPNVPMPSDSPELKSRL